MKKEPSDPIVPTSGIDWDKGIQKFFDIFYILVRLATIFFMVSGVVKCFRSLN